MDDLISRQAVLNSIDSFCVERCSGVCSECGVTGAVEIIKTLPSAQPEDWMERNKERILQAGMEGREIEFWIGGRLFAIREKAQ